MSCEAAEAAGDDTVAAQEIAGARTSSRRRALQLPAALRPGAAPPDALDSDDAAHG